MKVSFDMAEYTGDVDAIGTLRLLDAIRSVGLAKTVRFYQASTSELYGGVYKEPTDEKTPFYPRSPYGIVYISVSFCISISIPLSLHRDMLPSIFLSFYLTHIYIS